LRLESDDLILKLSDRCLEIVYSPSDLRSLTVSSGAGRIDTLTANRATNLTIGRIRGMTSFSALPSANLNRSVC
jgi:hypothetical protein